MQKKTTLGWVSFWRCGNLCFRYESFGDWLPRKLIVCCSLLFCRNLPAFTSLFAKIRSCRENVHWWLRVGVSTSLQTLDSFRRLFPPSWSFHCPQTVFAHFESFGFINVAWAVEFLAIRKTFIQSFWELLHYYHHSWLTLRAMGSRQVKYRQTPQFCFTLREGEGVELP